MSKQALVLLSSMVLLGLASAATAAITWSPHTPSFDNTVQLTYGGSAIGTDTTEPYAYVTYTGGANFEAAGHVTFDQAARSLASDAWSDFYGAQPYSSAFMSSTTSGLWEFNFDSVDNVEITHLLSGTISPLSDDLLYAKPSVDAQLWVYDGINFIYTYDYYQDKYGSNLVETGSRFFQSQIGQTYSLYMRLKTVAGWDTLAVSSPLAGHHIADSDYQFSADVIPEPASAMLLAIGFAAAFCRRKSR